MICIHLSDSKHEVNPRKFWALNLAVKRFSGVAVFENHMKPSTTTLCRLSSVTKVREPDSVSRALENSVESNPTIVGETVGVVFIRFEHLYVRVPVD